jgi:chemosensory pili system protein ChpA (sensor histidine kinase/response regulator)
MEPHHDAPPSGDLSALAWVHDELRRTLEGAHKALRRFFKEAQASAGADVDVIDPSILRGARQQLHQGAGALELVGLPAAAKLLRASEAAVQRMAARPTQADPSAVEKIERASFALLDYIGRRLAGKPVPAVALFPQYRVVQELAGADRIHPADLWSIDWDWRDLGSEPVAGRAADAQARVDYEILLLALMRGDAQAAPARASDLFAALAAGAGASDLRALWQLAAAFFEGQAHGLVRRDVYTKRVASRLLAQLRVCERAAANGGVPDLSQRLAEDLLFFCAQVRGPLDGLPRLAAVRKGYGLETSAPAVDYEAARLGRFDPAWVAQARKRLAAAKDAWSAVAGDDMHRIGGLAEQFSLVGDSLERLHANGSALAHALNDAAARTMKEKRAPSPELAMEVATAMLSIDATLEDAEFDHADLGARLLRLAERIGRAGRGESPGPLEGWMEDLYRRVSDRQTMGSVVHELQVALAESEKAIDQYFRKPDDPAVLVPVPQQLAAMRGVLSVLGIEPAMQVVVRMRDEIESLIAGGLSAEQAARERRFERLAGNLGALGFLIDMLSVQPHLAKSLFVFDAREGTLSPMMGRRATLSGFGGLDPVTPAQQLVERALSLAVTAAGDEMPIEDVTAELDRIAQDALMADQPALAASMAKARAALNRAEQPDDVALARNQIAEVLSDFVITASEPMGLEPELAVPAPATPPAPAPQPAAAVSPPAPPPAPVAELEGDDEMRGIFLEEAREVVQEAREALTQLAAAADDLPALAAVRRAFHTLKGSSRMVGLAEFGEAAWACEQLYNARLADSSRADEPLLALTSQCIDYFSGWVEALGDRRDAGHRAAAVASSADAMRLYGQWVPVAAPAQADLARAPSLPMDLPSAADLELPAVEPEAPQPLAATLAVSAEPPQRGFEQTQVLPRIDFDTFPAVEPVPSAQPVAALAPIELVFDESPSPSVQPLAEPISSVGGMPAVDLPILDLQVPEQSFSAGGEAGFAPVIEVDQRLPELPEVADLGPTPPSRPFMFGSLTAEPQELEWPTTELSSGEALVPESMGGEAFAVEAEAIEPVVPEWADLAAAAAPPDEAAEPVGEPPAAGPFDVPAHVEATGEPAGQTVAEAPATEAVAAPMVDAAGEPPAQAPAVAEEPVKRIGTLEVSIPLFNIFLNEADEWSRRLVTEMAEWALELHRPPGEPAISHAHALAGSSAAVGFAALSALARTVEHGLERIQEIGRGTADEARLFGGAADEIRRLLHQFAAGFLKEPEPQLLASLAEHEAEATLRLLAQREQAASAEDSLLASLSQAGPEEPRVPTPAEPPVAARPEPVAAPAVVPAASSPPVPAPAMQAEPIDGVDEDIDAIDAVDADLFPIFEEEAQELLPQLAARIGDWLQRPGDAALATGCMRTLHTLKGGARLAGAMRLGEMAHRMESAIEGEIARALRGEGETTAADIEQLQAKVDALAAMLDALRQRDVSLPVAEPVAAMAAAAWPPTDVAHPAMRAEPVPDEPAQSAAAQGEAAPTPRGDVEPAPIDWTRFAAAAGTSTLQAVPVVGSTVPERRGDHRPGSTGSVVRVRAPLLERLVNHAGEVSIRRARIESEVTQARSSLGDLVDNLERMRGQLRELEVQAETQIASRIEAAKATSQEFDPLEMDRFTRFQELTRMMAESLNDVATVQRALQRTIQATEDELAAQARLTRDLQDDLLRTRMVEFDGLADRLYRVVRLAAKETGKQVRMDIVGGTIEIDRGVLDRMTGAFEHLLRNCVTHGIEMPEVRTAAGKDASGTITLTLTHEGNEVAVEVRDDGGGLDLAAIRARAEALGLREPGQPASDDELAQLIFTPGFSTAAAVTELAGRGIGMDVVRSEVAALGGRVETHTTRGAGTTFKLVLPLTTAVTQVVVVRCGGISVAVPSTLVEIVRRATPAEVEAAYAGGVFVLAERSLPFYGLGALLQQGGPGVEAGLRSVPVVVVRSAQQSIALHVDEVIGNQEVVVKNLGPQLSRMPGLVGITLLASGAVMLIYNPVALATLYGEQAQAAARTARLAAPVAAVPLADEEPVARAPLVLVVDDSLTVRRVTQRLLQREGYRVVLAKDGLDALERLAEERPAVVLSDIEMPRMDGFDLVRNMRSDVALAGLPVIMITSRIAQKHRDYAAQLGVDHYLGKPYSEEELISLLARYTRVEAAT